MNSETTTEKLLRALELEKNGNWDAAHRIVQEMEDPVAYWIHAYLHRKEPDLSNASYWYFRAKKTMPDYDYAREWKEIRNFLTEGTKTQKE